MNFLRRIFHPQQGKLDTELTMGMRLDLFFVMSQFLTVSLQVSPSRATRPTVFRYFEEMDFGQRLARLFRGDAGKEILDHRRCDPLYNVLNLDQVSQEVPENDVVMSG
jgi:hypothetical protein